MYERSSSGFFTIFGKRIFYQMRSSYLVSLFKSFQKSEIMRIIFIVACMVVLSSCKTEGDLQDRISGKWQITAYEEGESNPFKKNMGEFEITDCDRGSVWNFLDDEAETLSDGTEVKKLVVSESGDCRFFDFESKWTIKGKNLFITSVSLGGIGGRSYAGLFEIVELNSEIMVIEISDARISFQKSE